jgi:hypothetical protein
VVRSRKPVALMLGQVEGDGFDAGGPSKDRVMTPTGAFPIRFSRFLPLLRRNGVTQKPTLGINQGAASQLVVNSSFTNQRADSFSASGVNLEAKV